MALSRASQALRASLEIFSDLFKVRQSFLLVLTGLLAYLIASRGSVDPRGFSMLLGSLTLSIFGTTGINMVLDSDIDALMNRTSRRVIPKGAISRRDAAALSSALLALGLALGFWINFWVFLAGFLGFFIDIAIYTALVKRRSWTSVIFGGFAGGMPALGGYAAHTGYPSAEALILMTLVALWSNAHIWYIAIYNLRDYERAGIPMLPVVKGPRAGVVGSIIHVILMTALLILYFAATGYGAWLTLVGGLYLSARLLSIMRRHIHAITREEAFRTFKYLSPYLALIFVFALIDSLAPYQGILHSLLTALKSGDSP